MRSLGEMAEPVEGAPLLREYGVKNSIEGSNPSLSAIIRKQDPRGRPRSQARAVSRHAPLRGMVRCGKARSFGQVRGGVKSPGAL